MKRLLFLIAFVTSAAIVSAQNDSASNRLNGMWKFDSASEVKFGSIPDKELPDLIFDEAAKTVTGFTGCNKMNGTYTVEGDQFMFGPIMSTKMACPQIEIDNYLSRFLPNVGAYKIRSGKLYLYDKNSKAKYVIYKRKRPQSGEAI